MAGEVDRRHQRDWLLEQFGDGGAERLRRQLHLPELVDQGDGGGGRRRQRRKGKLLEGGQIDAVLPNAGRAGKADVGQHRARPRERLDREADAAAAFAELLGDETRERNAGVSQERGESPRNGRLADRRPALDEQAQLTLGHGRAPYARARVPSMTDPECVVFLQWALPRLGLRWEGFRKVRRQVCRRVSRRMAELGLREADAYRGYLEGNEPEWDVVARLCRVTISRFWRDRAVFEALRDEVLPELGPAVSAWSVGCASGEEPYSLVLAAAEARVEIHVVATDEDPVLLGRARRASYPESSLRDLPADLHARAFEDGRLRPEYCQAVEFLRHDVRDTPRAGHSTSRSAETSSSHTSPTSCSGRSLASWRARCGRAARSLSARTRLCPRGWTGSRRGRRWPACTAIVVSTERGRPAMPKIDDYDFGRIVVDGVEQTRDVILLPGRVVPNWWRHDGHRLTLDDLEAVLDELPARLVVGTGAYGRMTPDPDALEQLRQRGVEVEALPTREAVRRYDALDPERTAAALHLTC
jgi:chemotaxis protein methyltransferase CheR